MVKAELVTSECKKTQVFMHKETDSSKVVGEDGSKVVGEDGSKVVGEDGSKVVGEDGSRVVGEDGSRVVGEDGSKVVGEDGSRVVGEDGSRVVGEDGSRVVGEDGSRVVGEDGSKVVGEDRSRVVGEDGSRVVGEDGSKVVGEDGSRVGISADDVSSRLEPVQPQRDVELQQDQLSIEHELVGEEEEGLRLRGSEFSPAQVVRVDSRATAEEDPTEPTDGGEGKVVDEAQEKSLSVEGSEERKHLQLPEDGGGGQEEDGVSGASREGGAQSESESSNVEQTDKGSSLDLGW